MLNLEVKMTSNSNGNSSGNDSNPSNLFKEFEASYGDIISTLVNEDSMFNRDKDTLQMEEEKVKNFMDLGRNLEMFFLRKKQLIQAHKPEFILKEDIQELKMELHRKDELIRRHFEKLGQWQELLQDMQSNTSSSAASTSNGAGQGSSSSGMSGQPGMPMGQNVRPPVAPGAPMQPGLGAPQGGFVPGNNYRMQMPGPMQDPLTYLERTTTNVGTPPMSR